MTSNKNLLALLSEVSAVASSLAHAVRSAHGTLSAPLPMMAGESPVMEIYRRPSGVVVVRIRGLYGTQTRVANGCSSIAIALVTIAMVRKKLAEEAMRQFDCSLC